MANETEIKLRCDASSLPALQAALDALASKQAPQRLKNTYFDTPNADLAHAKAALRIREQAGHFEQTFKTRGHSVAGIHHRGEWNWALTDEALNVDALQALSAWPATQATDALQAVFCTDFDRQLWRRQSGDSDIEIALDQGEIRVGEQRLPLCELELEVISGNPAELWTVLAELHDIPLWLSNISKAERGYALAGIRFANTVRPTFDPQADLSQALPSWLAYEWHQIVQALEALVFEDKKSAAFMAQQHLYQLHQLPQLASKLYRRQDTHALRQAVLQFQPALAALTAGAQLLHYLSQASEPDALAAEQSELEQVWQQEVQALRTNPQLAHALLHAAQALFGLPQAQPIGESAAHWLKHWLKSRQADWQTLRSERPQNAQQWRSSQSMLLVLRQGNEYLQSAPKLLQGFGEGRFQRTLAMLNALTLLQNPWPLPALTGTNNAALRPIAEYQSWAQEHLALLLTDL